MTPRHLETNVPTNQPVRFYKYIAIGFLLITLTLLGVVVFMSTKKATITITTKDSPVEVNFLATIGGSEDKVEGIATTTQVVFTQTFFPTDSKEVDGVATGKVMIFNKSGSTQPLVATTRFLSKDGILFRLKEAISVPANSSVEGLLYADKVGATGDLPASEFTIPGLNENMQKLIYGVSDKPMTGGATKIGIIGDKDLQDAEVKMLELAKVEGEKALAGVKGEKNVIVSVLSSEKNANYPAGAEVGQFTMTMTSTLVGLIYNPIKLKELAQNEIRKKAVDDAELIEPSTNEPAVTFDSFDSKISVGAVMVHFDGIGSLNPESKQLEKAMFFGKNNDEVRRYVLSLDHVHSVDVAFSPAWVGTVPHVKEHVNVIIKNTK